MLRHASLSLLAILLIPRAVLAAGDPSPAPAPTAPATDVYFGTSVVDPYRNFEDPKDAAAQRWIAGEAARSRSILDGLAVRPAVAAAVKAAASASAIADLAVVGDRVYYDRRTASGPTAIFVRSRKGGAERVVVEASSLGSKDAPLAIGAFAPSPDGSLVALHAGPPGVGTSQVIIVRASDGGRVDAVADSVFDAVGWLPDGRHIIYDRAGSGSTPDAQYQNSRVYVHALGTTQSSDRAIFGSGLVSAIAIAPSNFAFVDVPLGSAFAIAEVRDSANSGSRFYAAPVAAINAGHLVWTQVGSSADAFTDYAVHGNTIDLATAAGAPNFRVVRATLGGRFAPRTVLPEDKNAVISGTLDGIPKAGIFALNAAGDADYVQLLEQGAARLVRIPWTLPVAPEPIALPLRGTVLEMAADPRTPGAFVNLTSWTVPGDVFAVSPSGGVRKTGWGSATVTAAPARVALEIDAIAVDGTHIPVSIVRRADAPLDGTRPVMMQTIGAYGFSSTPAYDAVPEAWLALGGVYAVAHVRGGGELGDAWHAAGRGATKPNTWNDLVASAQALVTQGYASPQRLGLYGPIASYLGGEGASVAIGRAIETRPDLFRAAVVDAPAFDLLRAETTYTGAESVNEFGSTATRAGFDALYYMSPYAHIADRVRYPVVLLRSYAKSDIGDDWEAAKLAARLQASAANPNAALFDIATSRTRLRVDLYAFLLWQMGINAPPSP
jgi:prolyl oligopeptidase